MQFGNRRFLAEVGRPPRAANLRFDASEYCGFDLVPVSDGIGFLGGDTASRNQSFDGILRKRCHRSGRHATGRERIRASRGVAGPGSGITARLGVTDARQRRAQTR